VTVVVCGAIADALGATSQWVTVPYTGPAGRNFDAKREFSKTPSTEYRSVQAAAISVDVDHDRPIGQLKYLERRTDSKLFAVCEIDASGLEEGPWYFSPEIRHRGGKDIELLALAVTRSPASVGLGPVTAFAGTLREASAKIVYQDAWQGKIVRRAAAFDARRKRHEPLVVCSPPSVLREPEPRYVAAPLVLTRSERDRIPPQARPGWKPGDIEWSGHTGRVISVR
jgi:hypothetical protein